MYMAILAHKGGGNNLRMEWSGAKLLAYSLTRSLTDGFVAHGRLACYTNICAS